MAFTQVVFYFIVFNKYSLTSNYHFLGGTDCVRWSPSGDMIASVSRDTMAVLLDFKTGKVLYTTKTSDGSNLSLLIKGIDIS